MTSEQAEQLQTIYDNIKGGVILRINFRIKQGHSSSISSNTDYKYKTLDIIFNDGNITYDNTFIMRTENSNVGSWTTNITEITSIELILSDSNS